MCPACRSQSAGGLADMLLKAAFGPGRAAGETVACDCTPGKPAPQAGPHVSAPTRRCDALLACSAPRRWQQSSSGGFHRGFSSTGGHPPPLLQVQEGLR